MSSPSDGWESARTATRDDVRAAFAPRERSCPACGQVQSGGGRVCTECGADMTARYDKPRPGGKIALAALVVVLVAAVSYPIFSALRDDAADERAAAARKQSALEQSEQARIARVQRPVRSAGPAAVPGASALEHRAALVSAAERGITADVRGRVARGELKGRFLGTACSPYPKTAARRAAERSPSTPGGRYDCVAYTATFKAPSEDGVQRTGYFGDPYRLVIDYGNSALVWCKIAPRASEGGRSLGFVVVPPPCRDPAGPG
jgi:hypothetical protein